MPITRDDLEPLVQPEEFPDGTAYRSISVKDLLDL
jgi:hypothetical protein